jgi:hypothetical protein
MSRTDLMTMHGQMTRAKLRQITKACYETLHEVLSAAQPVALDMSDACSTVGAFG